MSQTVHFNTRERESNFFPQVTNSMPQLCGEFKSHHFSHYFKLFLTQENECMFCSNFI